MVLSGMPTHYRGTREETRALDAYITLMRAAESVTARTSKAMGAHDLSVSQFGALEALHHLGPMQLSELARKLLKTSGNITMVADNLEKRGLIVRKRLVDDRRCVVVQLTPRGKKLIEKVFPLVLAAIVAELSTLEAPEQDELHRLSRKLGLGNKLQG
jgi:MarR family transcriptional regulator, 2-MHQ and catechol-resistance regulon repressor